MPLPKLQTARLRIRPFTLDDLHVYHQVIHSHPDVMRYLPARVPVPVETTERILRYFIEHGALRGFSFMAVERLEDGVFIGHVGLHQLADAVEVGYALGRAYWGHGYATEAAHAMLRYGFETLNLPEIIALAFPENRASQRVMERLGMTYMGETHQYYDALLARYRLESLAFVLGSAPYQVSPG